MRELPGRFVVDRGLMNLITRNKAAYFHGVRSQQGLAGGIPVMGRQRIRMGIMNDRIFL